MTGVNNEPPQKLDSNEYFVRYGFQKTGELCDFKGSLQNKTKSSIPKVAKLSSQAEPDKGLLEFFRFSFLLLFLLYILF